MENIMIEDLEEFTCPYCGRMSYVKRERTCIRREMKTETTHSAWTEFEKMELIRLHNNGRSWFEISKQLKRGTASCKAKYFAMKKQHGRSKTGHMALWNQEEIDKLLELDAKGYKVRGIAEAMGRTKASIYVALGRFRRRK